MKNRNAYVFSLVLLILLLICMALNFIVKRLPDAAIIILCGLMLIDIAVLSYNTAKMVISRKQTPR